MATSGSGSVPGQLSVTFASGVVGAVVALMIAWMMSHFGLYADLGCHWQPVPDRGAAYAQIIWGGIIGLFFCLPLMAGSIVKRGLAFGLLPVLLQLLVVFPLMDHQRLLGLNYGYTTPFFVVLLGTIWGIISAGWLQMISK